MYQKKATRLLYILLLLLFFMNQFSGLAYGREVEEMEDLIHDAVNLVLEEHPRLKSQRRVLRAALDLPEHKRTFLGDINLSTELQATIDEDEFKALPLAGLRFSIPLYRPDAERKRIEDEYALLREREVEVQNLQEQKEIIISELMHNIDRIFLLNHREEGKIKLIDSLKEREELLKELIQGGSASPQDLWDLDERIVEIEVDVANLKSQQMLLIEEVARNLGGERWRDLKRLLEEISIHGKVVIPIE